jgi:glycerophosphoryl diester phosphodiesterase
MARIRLLLLAAISFSGCRSDPALPPCAADGLTHFHAHNDYGHARPLFDALEHGAASVEADVWLADGVLSVAHDREQVRPERTLEALYLQPLRAAVERGRIGPRTCRAGLQLLIDIKSEAEPSWRALSLLLGRYRDLLTRFDDGAARPGAITVVISGARAPELLDPGAERLAGYDARFGELVSAHAANARMPLVSDAWGTLFVWNGEGPMPGVERAKLDGLVQRAHAVGKHVRFWATPESSPQREAVWSVLRDAGVDYLNTDSLAAAQQFLLGRR